MKTLKVLAIVLLATFGFTAVNAQTVHHRYKKRRHHKRHHPVVVVHHR
jgi:hypothetical protein